MTQKRPLVRFGSLPLSDCREVLKTNPPGAYGQPGGMLKD
jgi:hypothetical protein